MKHYLHIVLIALMAFSVHKFILLPQLNIEDTVPVIFQHVLLSGFVLLIYVVSEFMSKHFLASAGFTVLGFITLKMILLVMFANAYEVEMEKQPVIKYLLFGFYFFYLIVLLLKIVPLLNVELPKNTNKDL